MRTWVGLVGWIVLCFVAAVVGNLGTSRGVVDWYPTLMKPSWNPPSWVFGPVWTTLYVMMGIAAWLVWKDRGWSGARLALTLFVAQLALNAAWSVLFFGMRRPGWAFAEILVLLAAILVTLGLFWGIRRAAGLLLVPYAAWVAFASILNGAIWRLNR